MFGGIDFPGDSIDHHVQVKVNGELVHDAWFDGFTEFHEVISLPAGLLTGVNDVVSVVVPGDTGLFADLVLIDELIVSAPAALTQSLSSSFPSLTPKC